MLGRTHPKVIGPMKGEYDDYLILFPESCDQLGDISTTPMSLINWIFVLGESLYLKLSKI